VDEPYVKTEDSNGTKVFKYYYGRWKDEDDETIPLHDTEGNPFYWPVPTYDLA
jgi:hypothetical protein